MAGQPKKPELNTSNTTTTTLGAPTLPRGQTPPPTTAPTATATATPPTTTLTQSTQTPAAAVAAPSPAAPQLHPLALQTARLRLREWRDTPRDHALHHALESLPDVVRYQSWGPRSPRDAAEAVAAVVRAARRAGPREVVELAVFAVGAGAGAGAGGGGGGEEGSVAVGGDGAPVAGRDGGAASAAASGPAAAAAGDTGVSQVREDGGDGADSATDEGWFVGRVGAKIAWAEGSQAATKADLWYSFLPAAQGRGYAAEAVEALMDALARAGVRAFEIECDPRNWGSRRLAERLGFRNVRETERAWESKGEWVGSVEFAREI